MSKQGMVSCVHTECTSSMILSWFGNGRHVQKLCLKASCALLLLTPFLLAALLFTLMGFAQMAQWALGKHRNYRREFGVKYPRGRKAIVPFLL